MKNYPRAKRKRTKQKSHVKGNAESSPQIVRRKDTRRVMTPLWILSGVAMGLAGVLCTISLSHYKFTALWIAFVGTVFAIAAVFVWLHATIAEHDAVISRPNKSEPVGSTLTPTQSASSRPATQLPFTIPSPITLPSATPEHRVAELSFIEVEQKLSEALNSMDERKYDEVKNALKGLQVDWTLNFHSADRDSSGKRMRVWLQDKRQALSGFVVVKLPLAGNERLPLMEQTDVFRVRGSIEDDPSPISIWLRDATLEYVRSDPKK